MPSNKARDAGKTQDTNNLVAIAQLIVHDLRQAVCNEDIVAWERAIQEFNKLDQVCRERQVVIRTAQGTLGLGQTKKLFDFIKKV